nr:MAG TPA: hypothetical protein [Caudoviricetes sp.]
MRIPLFRPQNAATRFLKAQTSNYITGKKKLTERICELLLYMRLFACAPYERVNDAGARLLHPVGCLYVRAGAAVCGCLCDRLSCPPLPPLLHLVSRSGGARPAGQAGAHLARERAQSGRFRLCPFCPRPSVCFSPPVQESSTRKP